MSPASSALFDRRQILSMLGAASLAARVSFGAASSPFQFNGLEHITLTASDVEKSVAFYARIFGTTVLKEKHGKRHYVKVGPNYLAIDPLGNGHKARGANQFCLSIPNFQMAEIRRSLDQLGLPHREAASDGVLVADPDGILIELWTENSWAQLASLTSPVSIPATRTPLLRSTGINHLLLAVSDPEKSVVFYEKILGPARRTPARPADNLSARIAFRAGAHQLQLAPLNQGIHTSGQLPGVDHFGIIAEFDRPTLVQKLEAAGAHVLPPIEDGSGVDFTDPDGVRIQVHNPPKPRA